MKSLRLTMIAIPLLSLVACVDVVGDGDETDTTSQALEAVGAEQPAAASAANDPVTTPNPRPTQPTNPPPTHCVFRNC